MSKTRKKSRRRRGASGSGNTMSSLRGGFQGLVRGGGKKKESRLSQVVTYILLAAIAALVAYRFTR